MRIKMKVVALLVGLASLAGIASAVVATPAPASASTCAIGGWWDHGNYYGIKSSGVNYYGYQGELATTRFGCANVSVVGDPVGGWYRFEIKVQDLDDSGYGPYCDGFGNCRTYYNYDQGASMIQMYRPSSGWSTAVTDTNGADFNYNDGNAFATWTSEWHCGSCGDYPGQYWFRFRFSSYYWHNGVPGGFKWEYWNDPESRWFNFGS